MGIGEFCPERASQRVVVVVSFIQRPAIDWQGVLCCSMQIKHIIKKESERARRKEGFGRTRLDRIRAFYEKERTELDEEDELHRQLLETIQAMLVEGRTRSQIIKTILAWRDNRWTRSIVVYAINEAMELFGSVHEAQKLGLRAILTERYMHLYQAAAKTEDLETQRRILEAIAKMNGLSELDQEIKQKRRRVAIQYTLNPEVLKQVDESETDAA